MKKRDGRNCTLWKIGGQLGQLFYLKNSDKLNEEKTNRFNCG